MATKRTRRTPRLQREATIWIVTADRTAVKIYEPGSAGERAAAIEEWSNPQGHMRERELHTDKPGRATYSARFQRYPLASRESARSRGLAQFMQSVATKLAKARRTRRFDHLVLAAEPRTLGVLRRELARFKPLRPIAEVRYDIMKLGPRLLARRLKSIALAAKRELKPTSA